MQPASGQQQPLSLPLSAAVSSELARLEAEVRQDADPLARARLAGLGDAAASRVLRKIWENRRRVQRLSAYIMRVVDKEVTERNAAGNPAAESSLPLRRMVDKEVTGRNAAGTPAAESSVPLRRAIQRQEDSVPGPLYCSDVPMEDQSPNAEIHYITRSFQEMVGPSGRVYFLRATASPQMLALGEMEEFDRIFLILVYLADYVLGTASNCWLTLMDRLLTPGVSQSEKDSIKIKMLELVDIYYWALDAPKTGNKIIIPQHLRVKRYPHFLEREPSYHSTSVLGNIYDQAKSQQESDTDPPIKVSPLKCFTEETVSEGCKRRWTDLYREHLVKSYSLCKLEDKEARNHGFRQLYQDYKRILYDAEGFETSPRSHFELLNEACAIYQVVYERAMIGNEVSKCGFAWKVAGRALCELYLLKHGGERVTCLRSVLEDAFKKYRA